MQFGRTSGEQVNSLVGAVSTTAEKNYPHLGRVLNPISDEILVQLLDVLVHSYF